MSVKLTHLQPPPANTFLLTITGKHIKQQNVVLNLLSLQLHRMGDRKFFIGRDETTQELKDMKEENTLEDNKNLALKDKVS